MKIKAIIFTLPLALGLAACDNLGIPDGGVSGNILGVQPSGSVRLAMQGLTVEGISTPVLDQVNVGTFNPEKRAYAISLPPTPNDGTYELFAYVDNGATANRYDSSETRTTVEPTFFLYSKAGTGDKSGNDCRNAKPGWTLCETLTLKAVKSGTPFTDYDLEWPQ